jgi:signal transduction histidine kinase
MSSKHILVIEDDDSVRGTLMDMLEMESYTVSGARDGRAGVAAARARPPDLIICDIMMPELGGFGVLAEIRQDASTDTIPFIFLSARSESSDIRHGMESGADDYLTKPFTRDSLLKAVAARLDKSDAARQHAQDQMNALRDSISLALPHEFRTPLQGLLDAASILQAQSETLSSADIRELSGMIAVSAGRLDRLVRKFILYTAIENALRDPARVRQARAERVTTAGDVVAVAARVAAERAGRAGDVSVETRDSTAAISETHLQTLVIELVDNACRYSAAGAPVRVSCHGDGSATVVAVSDCGRGMTPDQIANIGAFQQFDRRRREQQGAGLGLAIVQRLADLYGGSLDIRCVPGETIVQVRLPG